MTTSEPTRQETTTMRYDDIDRDHPDDYTPSPSHPMAWSKPSEHPVFAALSPTAKAVIDQNARPTCVVCGVRVRKGLDMFGEPCFKDSDGMPSSESPRFHDHDVEA